MASYQIQLKVFELSRGDMDIGEFAKTGIDAVDDAALPKYRIDYVA
jgi:hypothetical protein